MNTKLKDKKQKSDRPRTAILHYSAPPVIGGVEAVIEAHARSFVKHGYPIDIIAGRGEQDALPPGVDLHIVPRMDSIHPTILEINISLIKGEIPAEFEPLVKVLMKEMAVILKHYNNVIIHNMFTIHINLPMTVALFRLAENGTIQKCIAWCHDFSWADPHFRTMVHQGYPWDVLRTCLDEIIYVVVSKARQRTLTSVFKCPSAEIQVIYNGVDREKLLGLSDEGIKLINNLGLLESDLVLLMPVRVTLRKNIEFAMQVIAALKDSGYKPQLILTGPPDPHDDDSMTYFKELQDLRREYNIVDEFRFVFEHGPDPTKPFTIDHEIVSDFYRVSDVMFMPSHREGFGMPVVEAGLVGLPVISTEFPAATEIGGQDIVTFDHDEDPGLVAGRIVTWMEETPTHRLRRRVRQTLSWDAIFRQNIEQLLQIR